MYPEGINWDALGFLLDAENIERNAQLDAEKKSNVYANHMMCKFKLRENNFYQLIDSSQSISL